MYGWYVFVDRDHPRSRGVYLDREHEAVPDGGSSPLARGLPITPVQYEVGARIIPARAGFTRRVRRWRMPGPDHPRSRGVYNHITPPNPRFMGSSPLARGLLGRRLLFRHEGGIIPARAGFTRSRPWPSAPPRDHPRSRGVYTSLLSPMAAFAGSSPLARGLPVRGAQHNHADRIIPARAGFTDAGDSCHPGIGDHPRSRGVYPRL